MGERERKESRKVEGGKEQKREDEGQREEGWGGLLVISRRELDGLIMF